MINEEEVKIIEKNIKETAKELGLELTNNLPKIARAKAMMFGVEEWHRCCCVRDDEHFCISEKCRKAIEKDGICDCRLYTKEK